MSMSEIQEAAEVITGAVSPDANIIFGASIRPELEDEIAVTVVATGFDSNYYVSEKKVERTAMESESSFEDEKPVVTQEDFATENKTNMWDSIKTGSGSAVETETGNDTEDDLDIPPALRERMKGKKNK